MYKADTMRYIFHRRYLLLYLLTYLLTYRTEPQSERAILFNVGFLATSVRFVGRRVYAFLIGILCGVVT